MEFIDENFLKKNGLTKITCEFGEEQVKPNNPKYNVSLELDENQLFNFSEALSAQEKLDEITDYMDCLTPFSKPLQSDKPRWYDVCADAIKNEK
jgi:hypothetical protein